MDMGQWTGSKLGRDYTKAVYRHPDYLIYMQSTSIYFLSSANFGFYLFFSSSFRCKVKMVCLRFFLFF